MWTNVVIAPAALRQLQHCVMDLPIIFKNNTIVV